MYFLEQTSDILLLKTIIHWFLFALIIPHLGRFSDTRCHPSGTDMYNIENEFLLYNDREQLSSFLPRKGQEPNFLNVIMSSWSRKGEGP